MPMRERRSCLRRTQYRICRTWFFELLFTLLPMLLMVLIIVGLFAFENVNRQVTTSLLYKHSMAPVTITLRRYFNEKMGFLDYAASVIETGQWTDFEDPDATAKFFAPYYARSLANGNTISPASQAEIAAFGSDLRHYMSVTYTTQTQNPYNVLSLTSTTVPFGNLVTTRDRFLMNGFNFATYDINQLQSLALSSPNVTETVQPNVTATALWDATSLSRCAAMPCFIFNNIVNDIAPFGVRFTANHAPVISTARSVTLVSDFFITLNASAAFSRVLPSCGYDIHAMIMSSATLQLVYYNCDPTASGLTLGRDFGLRTMSAPLSSLTPGNTLFPKIAVSAIPNFLADAGVYYLVTVNNATNATGYWQGHSAVLSALTNYVAQKVALVNLIAGYLQTSMPTLSSLDGPERFFTLQMVANPYILAVHQLLPSPIDLNNNYRNLLRFELTTNAAGNLITRTRVYSSLTVPTSITTTRSFATAKLTSLGSSSSSVLADWQLARMNLESGATPFLNGFDELKTYDLLTPPIVKPAWAYWLATLGFPTGVIANVTDSVVVMYRTAQIPLPSMWSTTTTFPPYAFLRLSFGTADLTSTLTVLLGATDTTSGAVYIIDDLMNIVAFSGSSLATTVTVPLSVDDFKSAMSLLQTKCSSKDSIEVETASACDPITNERLAYTIINRVGVVSESEVVSVSLLMSFPVIEGHWWVVQKLPQQLTTSTSSSSKLFGAGALVVALLFLLLNVCYVLVAINSTVNLKRFLRRISAGEAATISDANITLSSNNEIREIELAVLKIKKATIEYNKFLPRGLEQFDEDAEQVRHAREEDGSAIVPMTSMGAAATASRAVSYETSSPSATAGSPGRSYDDMLLRHQTGVTSRIVAVVALDIVDAPTTLARLSSSQTSVLFAKMASMFHRHCGTTGGMMMPMGAGSGRFTAVWTSSAVRNVKALACVAAVNVGAQLTEAMEESQTLRFREVPFQCIITVDYGTAYIGMLGDSDGSKAAVFQGPVFDTSAEHLFAAASACRSTVTTAGGAGHLCLVTASTDVLDEGASRRVIQVPFMLSNGRSLNSLLAVAPSEATDVPEQRLVRLMNDAQRGAAPQRAEVEDLIASCKSKLVAVTHPAIAAMLSASGGGGRS